MSILIGKTAAAILAAGGIGTLSVLPFSGIYSPATYNFFLDGEGIGRQIICSKGEVPNLSSISDTVAKVTCSSESGSKSSLKISDQDSRKDKFQSVECTSQNEKDYTCKVSDKKLQIAKGDGESTLILTISENTQSK
ncbi:hypothetical protein MHLP_01715 [Candidatus Mycoplasma haematolamae str. Purdue]|uniref:Uncharacterized protein n=1 Tax=Mycoplasma haematolamae (strain Purdue) TaxID=1212765 RepID=I7BJA9_MYCHA|nr:hypothetical protein [Candidatus Mycoplasma haematolamae]AFO51923.1 hypothetical protein MHLP_01715 [Candidatus Mycoplasma haematolamae str. Purdue]